MVHLKRKLFIGIPCGKVLQQKKRTTTYGLRLVLYTGVKFWNDLFPMLSDNVEPGVFKFKSLLKISSTDHLNPAFI